MKSEATLAGSHRKILALSLLLTLCGIVFIVVTTSRLLAPLRSLMEGTQRVAAGDLDHVVEAERPDEFGEVARSFNRNDGGGAGLARRARAPRRGIELRNSPAPMKSCGRARKDSKVQREQRAM